MLSPDLFSALSNRSLFDNQYASELVNQARPVLNSLAKWLRERLSREGDRISTQKRLDKLLEDVRKRASRDYAKLSSQYLQDFDELAIDEAQFVSAAMATVVLGSVVTPRTVKLGQMVIDGKAYRFSDYVRSIEGWTNEIASVIAGGYVEGQSVSQIAATVIGTRDARYQDGLIDRSRRGIEQVVRTAITDVSTQARLAVIAANDDICYGYRIVATLDSKTSAQCRSWDQTVIRNDAKYKPRPPFHRNCRTGIVPEIRGAALSETGATRASNFSRDSRGQVSAQTQYYELLKKQPAALQDRVLGKARGLIFRNSGLSAEEFRQAMVDQMGRPKTLAEMADDNAMILRYMKSNDLLQGYLPGV